MFVNNKLYSTAWDSTFWPTLLEKPIEPSRYLSPSVAPTCDEVVLYHTSSSVSAHPTSAMHPVWGPMQLPAFDLID